LDFDVPVARLLARSTALEGTIYRSTSPRYATSSDLVSGAGSRLHGGRWNPVGVAAVYGSFTPETALAETLAHCRYYGLPVHAAMPRTFVAIEFVLSKVLDLTRGRNRQNLGVSQQRLLECDWRAEMQRGLLPLTQQVAVAAFKAGLEALLVASAADPAGKNLIVFVDRLQAGSRLAVIRGDRLS